MRKFLFLKYLRGVRKIAFVLKKLEKDISLGVGFAELVKHSETEGDGFFITDEARVGSAADQSSRLK